MTTTTPARTAPWAVGQRPSVRVSDTGLSDDLRLLAEHHGTVSDAIRAAVRHTATSVRQPPSPLADAINALADDHTVTDALDLLARTGLTNPTDAIRWALDHAASAVYDTYAATGQLPNLDTSDSTEA